MKRRKLIGVIGAEVSSVEQRQILGSIIETAQKHNTDVAVISNVFNPNPPQPTGEIQIYNLIQSDDFDALIVLSESIVSDALKHKIQESLMKKHIPIVAVGSSSFLESEQIPVLNTSDANDIEAITAHLIEAHGFTQIDLLTGYAFLQISQDRVQGYRHALEKHGIPFDESRIYYGDFWTTSGTAHAERYLSGELPMPQALVCANDYMAFGLLDTFEKHHVNIMGKLAVVGYEAIPERHLHYPILTTYQRNRRALGQAAVEQLLRMLCGEPDMLFTPPEGSVCCGSSCPCPPSKANLYEELASARTNQQYHDWNLRAEYEQKLTECKSFEAFADVMGEFEFLVRYVQDITLCLFDDWYGSHPDSMSDVLRCRSVMPWLDRTPYYIQKLDLSAIISRHSEPAAYYFSPLFFRDKLFGQVVLRYDQPDTYDDTYRNWLKSTANALEFLRMKNDVRYLTQCQNFADDIDTMTGLYSVKGLYRAFSVMKSHGPEDTIFPAIFIRVCIKRGEPFSKEYVREHIAAVIAAAGVTAKFTEGRGLCGRVDNNAFMILMLPGETDTAVLADALQSLLLSHNDYMKYYGTDSLCVIGGQIGREDSFEKIRQDFTAKVEAWSRTVSRRCLLPYYPKLLAIRDQIYREPVERYRIEDFAKQCTVSVNYLNIKYKECFGISFHQDCINSRLVHAKHLLIETDVSIAAIAEQCGFSDSKYFFRQFRLAANMTPKKYRTVFGTG